MKKNCFSKAGFITTRNFIGLVLCVSAISLAMFSFAGTPTKQARAKEHTLGRGPLPADSSAASLPPAAPTPTGGTLTSANIGSGNATNYSDSTGALAPNLTFFAGQGTCAVPMSCSTFTLTIDPSVGMASGSYDPTKYNIFIEVSWPTAAEDYDTWMCSGSGNCTQANVVASNASTADPETITLPTSTAPGAYTINLVNTNGAAEPYTGTIYLKPIPQQTNCNPATTDCTPPRYINYPAGQGQADDAGEPSLGVDWNPNVAALKNGPNPPTGGPPLGNQINLNTGGVAFFTSGPHEWRVNFDDCPSPAVNVWEDVSATTTQQFVLSDPIGFVDHYTNDPMHLGQVYPEPHTPGRVFTIDLIGGQGNSLGSFSDTDGNSYLPGGSGGPGQGPDHETLGGGPYNMNAVPPPPPQPVAYPTTGTPNAIYYCSQNIVAEAQCSRSDDGGVTFGPGVVIYNPTVCTGGIHGHVKVASDGTVYVPNSSCGTAGNTGVAVSTDNGLTWTERNVPGSTSTQDPSVGIGQNNVGLPLGQTTNTIYIGYADGDGHLKIAHSGDRGGTWSTPADVGTPFGITHAVFPVVVAGDDNRAAFAFLGTGPAITVGSGTCDPYGATLNCGNIWHLYIATTYDGGANWLTIDATPNDPVQTGTVCLQGTTCAGGRNLLDFNDFAIDAEGRGLVGYADGCVNCNNSFQGQSAASHGTVARQSGGRRLFAHFDPVEPAVPAAPQLESATKQSPSGALISWLEPDNGGLAITGYKVYRGTTSGGETFLATVSGETTTSYFDPSPPSGNIYYFVTAVNAHGESAHCGELLLAAGPPPESECKAPGLTELTDPAGDTNATVILNTTTPAPPGADILKLQLAQPYQADGIPRLVFTITTDNGQSPQAAGEAWYAAMKVPGGYKGVRMAWKAASLPNPVFESYTPGANNSGGVDGRFVTAGSEKPLEPGSSYLAPFNQVVLVVKASDLGLNPGDAISGFIVGTEQSSNPADPGASPGAAALFDMAPDSLAFTGMYTVENNETCRPNLPPVAVLTANPVSGPPGTVVHFDGSGSHDPDTAPPADTIVSYHFDFGDGTSADCPGNAACTGTGKVDHTYNNAGDYPARLTVTESRGGLKSTNPAQVIISIASNSIQPVAVVSRMQHGSITPPFEVNLPITGIRGVECRSSSTLGAGNYQMVFKFANPLTSVAGASVTTGTGSVSSSGISPNTNEYVVNLTGVANAQYIAVTLTNVQDSAGNSGNVVGPQMGVLIGDVNGNGVVSNGDVSLVQAQVAQPVTSSNFRDDVNANGTLSNGDVSLTQTQVGQTLPSSP